MNTARRLAPALLIAAGLTAGVAYLASRDPLPAAHYVSSEEDRRKAQTMTDEEAADAAARESDTLYGQPQVKP